MKIIKYTFTILLILILTSCEEHFYSEIEPPNNRATPKIVIHSFISPSDEDIRVSVKLSSALFSDVQVNEDDYIQIKNANVKIKNLKTSRTINLLYDNVKKNYFTLAKDFSIKEKISYQLTVKYPGYKTVTAVSTIPTIISSEIRNIKIKKTIDKYDEYSNETEIYFEMKDNPKEKNYYLASIEEIKDNTIGNYYTRRLKYIFTDENKNGKTLLAKPEKPIWTSIDEPFKKIIVELKSVDKGYYNYEKSVNRQFESADNPFAEPVILVSNIKGGLGVFGSYTLKKTKKTF